MAYTRKCTDEELSRIRSENARKGTETRRKNGTLRGGRKRSLDGKKAVPKVIAVDEADYLELQRYAADQNTTMINMFHRVMVEYRKNVACGDDDDYYGSDGDGQKPKMTDEQKREFEDFKKKMLDFQREWTQKHFS